MLTGLFDVQKSVGYTADSLMNLDCLFSTDAALDVDGTDFSFFNAAAITIYVPLAVFVLSNIVRTAIVVYLTRSARRGEYETNQPHPGDIELHECVNLDADAEGSDKTAAASASAPLTALAEAEVKARAAEAELLAMLESDRKKKTPSLVSRKFIAGWIIIFVTLQPALTKAVFGLFACQHLEDGTRWVSRDMQVGCFSAIHKRWLFSAGIPGAILYALGIPLGAALLLYSVRKELETRPIKKKFGFLYSGCARLSPTSPPRNGLGTSIPSHVRF